ncbi:MAG: crossover junction endodeoxyribonuclease RuvC, partial [Actinobacteria bacterium]|nr:crossover junction endodeoxyribonuclease RuvC [Actinomycetota bacterium]
KRKIPVVYYTPTQVKAAVTGSGSAKKPQVSSVVMKILKLGESPKPADATDALAIAITAAWRAGIEKVDSSLTSAQIKWRDAENAAKKRRS